MAKAEALESKEDEVSKNPGKDKAASGGWRPEKEWEGASEDWIDYREFNVRGELMGRIQEQSSILNQNKQEMAEQRQALQDVVALQDQIAQREYDKIMRQLKAAKAEAIDSSDGTSVAEIDDQIDALKTQRNDSKEVKTTTQKAQDIAVAPEVTRWLEAKENQWYSTDKFMQGVANAIAGNIMKENPNLAPSVVLQRMDDELRRELPHKFKGRGQPVDDGGGDGQGRPNSGGGRKRTFSDLSEEEQGVAKRLEKTGTMSIDKYIATLDGV